MYVIHAWALIGSAIAAQFYSPISESWGIFVGSFIVLEFNMLTRVTVILQSAVNILAQWDV